VGNIPGAQKYFLGPEPRVQVFLANFPEAMSSAALMIKHGDSSVRAAPGRLRGLSVLHGKAPYA
jgi:hypothetical protein